MFFLSLNFSLLGQDLNTKDCRQFKKAYLLFEAKEGEIYLIKRNRIEQKEIELYSGNQATTKVRWLSDCVYELTLQKEKKDSTKNINIPIIVRIREVKGKSYTFSSASFDDLIILEGKMRKIRRREYRRRLKGVLR